MSYEVGAGRPRVAFRPRVGLVSGSVIGFGLLSAASWAYILLADSGVGDLFGSEAWRGVWRFVRQLAGSGSEGRPAFLDGSSWAGALRLSVDTLAMSVLAIAIAGAGALLTFMAAARNVALGENFGRGSATGLAAFVLVRTVYIFTRGIPELVWAMLIVFLLSPGILPGALALGLHNFGILGKLSAEVVEGLDPRPARALRASGAGVFQTLAYSILPQALPQLLTYLLYRWEVVIRTTVVVGLVSAGGLGHELRLGMSFFKYDEVALLLLCYLLLVIGVDLAAAGLRRLAR